MLTAASIPNLHPPMAILGVPGVARDRWPRSAWGEDDVHRRFRRAPIALSGLGACGPSEVSSASGAIGSGLLKVAPVTGPAAPFVAAAGGVAQLVGAVASLFGGCGCTCTEATTLVNQAEPYFLTNLNNYIQNPNRTVCDQANAIATFQQMWLQIEQQCGNPSLGAAGERCISDRGPNGCTWKNNGQCWNWFVGYYYPILNDTPPGGTGGCGSDPGGTSSTTGVSAGLFSSGSSSMLPLLLLAGLGLLVFSL